MTGKIVYRRRLVKGEFVEIPTFFIGLNEVTEKEFLRQFPDHALDAVPMTESTEGWPIISSAAKVHPVQVEEAMANAKKHGVPTDFLPDGRPVFRSRQHRKNYCEKVRGLHDMDGGYGDPKSTFVWD